MVSLLTVLALSVPALAAINPFWDGRIPKGYVITDLDDSSKSPYNVDWNKGRNLKWSEILSFPTAPSALFDAADYKPFELSITDKSIFAPGGNAQNGFRRSELMPNVNSGSDTTVQGTSTFHWSIRADTAHRLNFTHAYELVFIETQNYDSHIFTLTSGTPRGRSTRNSRSLRIEGSTANGASPQTLHDIDFTENVWHNYAVKINFDSSQLTVYYSTGDQPLKQVVAQRYNDARGKGQWHIGILKLPTGQTSDVVKSGYQPSGINEGLVYSSVWIEKDTVTLNPAARRRARAGQRGWGGIKGA